MTERPSIRLDPERLREERRDVDLGDEETGFNQVRVSDDSAAKPVDLDEPAAGVTPPAR